MNGQNSLPADPMVTPGASACGTVSGNTITGLSIQNPPVFPVLVDGALFHTGTIPGTQTFQVTLPSNVACTNCVLQIVEFMSAHGLNNPGGCFYHHCANISIQGTAVDGGAGTGSGGTSGGTDAGGTGTGTGSGGSSGGTGSAGTSGGTGSAGASGGTGSAGASGGTGSAGAS